MRHTRDIDEIIERVVKLSPAVRVRQLKVSRPSDDDGIWFFEQPQCKFEVQLESSTGMCPFLIETDECDIRLNATTVEQAVTTLTKLLRLRS